tara:strand:+ start:1226 stop:2218 length:993 start_codon:yes stop_codon:yes gene_type:complete
MIIKSFELNKIKTNGGNLILFYGKNEGEKNQYLKKLKNENKSFYNYDEKAVLENPDNFFNSVLTKSLFENEKVIVIKRVSEKILKIINKLTLDQLSDTLIILSADILDKKSKLRSFFEKSKEFICVPFYPDNEQTLSRLASNFLREKKIIISQSNINLIIGRSNGDRETLLNELKKIEFYCKGGKKITTEFLSKLTNLVENHSISELVDSCLAKEPKKISNILNENNFSNEDCILIIRTFLNKTKKILILSNDFSKNKNIEKTISAAKPPIFWKDKEITRKQIMLWEPKNLKQLIYKLNDIELQIKKNLNNSIQVVTDFILEMPLTSPNN